MLDLDKVLQSLSDIATTSGRRKAKQPSDSSKRTLNSGEPLLVIAELEGNKMAKPINCKHNYGHPDVGYYIISA